MAVNTSIYGTSSQWQDVHTFDDSIQSKDRVKAVYFGGSRYYDNDLLLGNSIGKTPFNQAIDKSLSYCGLGTESSFSHLKYYDILDIQAKSVGSTVTPFFKEERDITNFAFAIGNSNRVSSQTFLNARNTTHGNNSRWAPTNGSVNNNTSRRIWFLSQFAFNNFIALINVHCFDGTFSDGKPHNANKVTLSDYENNVSNIRTDCPFIYAVTIHPYVRYNAQNDRIPMQSTADGKAIEILDSYNGGTSEAGAPFYTYGALQNDYDGEFIIHGLVTGRGTASYQSDIAIPPEKTIFQIACIPDTWVLKVTKKTSDYINQQTVREYDSDFYDECMTATACFGLFFTDKLSIAVSGELNDPEMYCGTLENGVGHGHYTHGTDNIRQPQYNKTSNNIDYDPYNPPQTDPNHYDNTSGFNSHLNAPTGFNKRYVLSEGDIRDLNSDFYQALNSKPSDIDYINYSMSEFLTNNPIEAIVSLKWFPFSVPTYGSAVTINLGNYSTSVSAPVYTGSGVESYEIGSFELYPYFGNTFLDYEPYSKTSIVIPYCGTVELDHSVCMGKTISVHMTVDIYTGACTAYIKADGLVIDSVSGVCCVDLPVTGIDNATLEGQIYNASLNLKSSKITEGTTIASSGLSFGSSLMGTLTGSTAKRIKGAINSVSSLVDSIENVNQSTRNLAQNEYNVSHVQIPIKSIGAQSGIGNAKQEQFCRVLYIRPVFLNGSSDLATWYSSSDSTTYGHTVGYACIKQGALSDFSGYTVCSNVDLSGVPATDSEKEQILKLLQSGVYL